MLSAILSVITGGATGILGVIVQRFFDLKNKRLDIELAKEKGSQELALRRVDYDIMEKEWIGRVQVAQVEGEARSDVADSQAFAASLVTPAPTIGLDKATPAQAWLMVILDFFRGLIRPLLTVYLCALTTVIYFNAHEVLKNYQLKPEQALETARYVIDTVLYLSTTCTLHWFGTRNKSPFPKMR